MPTVSDVRPLGLPLPDVTLAGLDGVPVRLHDVVGTGPTLVAFMCNHCPYVQHVEAEFGAFAREAAERGLSVIAIMSNDVAAYPEDGADGMRAQIERAGWGFPYLIDAEQELARRLGAACTPDLFLFDAERQLVHRGAFDDSTPGNGRPVTGAAARLAAEAVVTGTDVPTDLPPALGCGIKWRPGTQPD